MVADQPGTDQPGALDLIETSDLVCPNCGSTAVDLVEIIAPKGEQEATRDTFVGGLGGATVGGILGATLGPGGVALGIMLGGGAGSAFAAENAQKQRAAIECHSCDYKGEVTID